MWWLILIFVIIAAFAIPRFGIALAVTVVVGVALGGVWLYEERAEQEVAKTHIQQSEVYLVGLTLKPGPGSGSYSLVGRVQNGSQYTLTHLRLKLTMRDCIGPDQTDCEVVGETEVGIPQDVPSGQARDLDEYVSFYGLGQARGSHQWDYQVVEISGR